MKRIKRYHDVYLATLEKWRKLEPEQYFMLETKDPIGHCADFLKTIKSKEEYTIKVATTHNDGHLMEVSDSKARTVVFITSGGLPDGYVSEEWNLDTMTKGSEASNE